MSKDDECARASKLRLFWTLFRIDKALSLRLGRPSTIQEWDVALPDDPVEARWTKIADTQGRVYDQMYSLLGMSRPKEERATSARKLAEELRAVMADSCKEDEKVDDSSPNTWPAIDNTLRGSLRLLLETRCGPSMRGRSE